MLEKGDATTVVSVEEEEGEGALEKEDDWNMSPKLN